MTSIAMLGATPLVIATHNEGKIRELRALLAPLRIETLTAASLGLPEPEETGATFHENARIKSRSAAERSGHWALADDSGLSVEALDGQPGVHSADWAGPDKDFSTAFERIKRELAAKAADFNHLRAFFTCVLALSSPQGMDLYFEGRVEGRLIFPPRGSHGFGYDAIFMPDGHKRTFAEMEQGGKQAVSHRARALEQFTRYLARSKEPVP